MPMASISTLSTENTEVARLVLAHNAVAQVLDAYQVSDLTREQLADLYVTQFAKLYAGIRAVIAAGGPPAV
jgi:hypothetical protein